jgi:hypothetical protein
MINVAMTEDAADFLAAVALNGLTDAAAEFARLDERTNPESYPRAQRQLAAAVEAVYALRHAGYSHAPAPVESLESKYEPGALQLMRDHGLDPAKELGPHHPQASHPSCVHGRRFYEDCARCSALGLDGEGGLPLV